MDDDRNIIIAAEAGISIQSVAEITDAVGECYGADGLLLAEADLSPAFFDLKSGFAGELLQKFANYRLRAAIIIPAPEAYGERFQELAYEHRTHPLVRFVATREAADDWLRRA